MIFIPPRCTVSTCLRCRERADVHPEWSTTKPATRADQDVKKTGQRRRGVNDSESDAIETSSFSFSASAASARGLRLAGRSIQTATEVSASMNTPAPTSTHSSHFLTDFAISCHCVLTGAIESTEVGRRQDDRLRFAHERRAARCGKWRQQLRVDHARRDPRPARSRRASPASRPGTIVAGRVKAHGGAGCSTHNAGRQETQSP
jgi:hypothetical protein